MGAAKGHSAQCSRPASNEIHAQLVFVYAVVPQPVHACSHTIVQHKSEVRSLRFGQKRTTPYKISFAVSLVCDIAVEGQLYGSSMRMRFLLRAVSFNGSGECVHLIPSCPEPALLQDAREIVMISCVLSIRK